MEYGIKLTEPGGSEQILSRNSRHSSVTSNQGEEVEVSSPETLFALIRTVNLLQLRNIKQPNLEAHRSCRCRKLQALHQQAVKKTLTGLPIHDLGSGRYTVPVLEPGEGGLPFSMSLDLYRGITEVPRSDVSSRPQHGIFSLQYILEGTGQVSWGSTLHKDASVKLRTKPQAFLCSLLSHVGGGREFNQGTVSLLLMGTPTSKCLL